MLTLAMSGNSENTINRPLRALFPSGPTASAIGPVIQSAGVTAKRKSAAAACERCRKYKAKCSAHRPTCRGCAKRQVPCVYSTNPGETLSQATRRENQMLRSAESANQEFLNLVTTLPRDDALTLVDKLRGGQPVVETVDEFKTGQILIQMAVQPDTRLRYDLPYKAEMPQEYLINSPYMSSLLYQVAGIYGPDHAQNAPPPSSFALQRTEQKQMYLKPFHSTKVIDPRLTDVKPSLWTSVSKDDTFMRELLAEFFRCEYFFTMIFHKDYFLEDMAAERTEFCSCLLVNIVMAYCCVCHSRITNRFEYWNPNTLVYRFFAEAKRLWDLETTIIAQRPNPQLTTIQAGIIFNVFHNLCGIDQVGQSYRLKSIAMANQMGLYDGPITSQNERARNGKIFTAWALFAWETLIGFSFQMRPELQTPPHDPLPDPATNADWYGEIWLKYPDCNVLLPSQFAHVFHSKCQFRIIMNRFAIAAYDEDNVKTTLEHANALYVQLRGWFYRLPEQLLPRNIVLPAQLQLHIYYYYLLVAMYDPLLSQETNQDPSPRKIVDEAIRNMHILTRLYYIRHSYEAMDLFIVVPLMFMGHRCLEAIAADPEASDIEAKRATLMLIATGLYKQRKNHHLSHALYNVIRAKMRDAEVRLLKGSLDIEDGEDKKSLALKQAVLSQWPVTIAQSEEEKEANVLANLVEELHIGGEHRDLASSS